MSEHAEVVALVEGPTEKIFMDDMIVAYLAAKNVFIKPVIVSKPGQKGGDVKFSRVMNDIRLHLKQRRDTYLTMFLDFYGLKNDWPGLRQARQQTTPGAKAEVINRETKRKVEELLQKQDAGRRFLSYFSMHEFEALLFSEPRAIARSIHVPREDVEGILKECGEPENIDDSPNTAPSKRLLELSARFKKTTTGIAIAREIGLDPSSTVGSSI